MAALLCSIFCVMIFERVTYMTHQEYTPQKMQSTFANLQIKSGNRIKIIII